MIKIGNKEISKLFIGGKEIGKVYVGDKAVWPEGNAGGSGDTSSTDWSNYLGPSYREYAPAVLWDSVKQQKLVVEGSELANYDKDRYTPIGVLVIPPEHDVYGTGEGAMMSIVLMNCDTPDEGSSELTNIYWGPNRDESLPNFRFVPRVTNSNNPYIYGQEQSLYLPSDISYFQYECGYDSNLRYNNSSYIAPSPYLNDGSRNPLYYSTESPSSTGNCLSDFDGKGNTEKMLELATEEEWKTNSYITNYYAIGFYPSFCCCWRYHTVGTEQGDWYLPAMGELGYIMVRFTAINKVLETIKSIWNIDVYLLPSYYHQSSTEYGPYSDYCYRALDTYGGNVSMNGKTDRSASCCVRAYSRI